MPKRGAVNVDIKKLQELYEGLKTKPTIQVGVFQSKTARREGGLTNAELASYHEYGSPETGLPPRSILRTPIKDHAAQIMEPFRNHADELLVEHGSKIWKLIGIAAEKVIKEAFATGGFGKWAPLTYKTLLGKLKGSLKARRKKITKMFTGQVGMGILIRTGELRRSFSSRVVMKF